MPPANNAELRRWRLRRGLTLLELMIATSVSTILADAPAVLASVTRQTSDFNSGQSTAVQHARVVHDRLQRFVGEVYATETYPGVVVVDETANSYRHCDTVVIWHPTGTTTNAAGPPLVKELIIIGPDQNAPKRLIEFTAPADTRTIELNEASLNTTIGRSLISLTKSASTTVKTLLAPLVRTASTGASGSNSTRAAIRFECELLPTTAELSSSRSG